MVKKSVKIKKPAVKKRISKKTTIKTVKSPKIEKVLVENFVALQKVMANLSSKFDNLANQISKLLNLFEMSAKSLAKKEFTLEKGGKESKEMLKKIDNLFEQNKIIARGLTLLHEQPERQPAPSYPVQQPQALPQQMPRPTAPGLMPKRIGGYQKSISTKPTRYIQPPKKS